MEPDQKKVHDSVCEVPLCHLGIFLLRYSKPVTDSILTQKQDCTFGKPGCGWVKPPTVHVWGSQISISVTKLPPPPQKKSNLKEESFILAPGFRDFCPCLLVLKQNVTTEGMVEYRSSSPAPEKDEGEGRKEKERERGEGGERVREGNRERELECSRTRFLIYSSHAPSGPLSQPGPAS